MRYRSWFASAETEQLLAENGVRDLDDAFRVGQSLDSEHEYRGTRHAHKRVVQLNLNGPDGPTRVYIKRQWQRTRLIPRPTDIRHRTNVQCSPVHEWRGLRILQNAGFHVSEPLALFWKGWGFSRGAVVTRGVPPQWSVDDLMQNGRFQAMSAVRQNSLIDAIVDVVARLHRSRLSWRSMKTKHFYPEETAPGEWRIWLIDCEGVSRWAMHHDCQKEWRTYTRHVAVIAPAFYNAFLESYNLAMNC